MKSIIIGAIIGLITVVFSIGLGFAAGVQYGVEETSKIYCEGLNATIGALEVDEQSSELTLSGERYGECEGTQFVITRTK